jgi:hypothetical protein
MLRSLLLISLSQLASAAPPVQEVDADELRKRAQEVASRFDGQTVDMCGFDVLCADDPTHPGVVSAELRSEDAGVTPSPSSEDASGQEVPIDADAVAASMVNEDPADKPMMVDSGRQSLCKCVIESRLGSMDELHERMSQTCLGNEKSPSALWFSKDGQGRALLLNWASAEVNKACGRNAGAKDPKAPPCDWNYAVKRIPQLGNNGVLGYANDIECAWRLNGWKPPSRKGSVAQTLLRSQLKPFSVVIADAKEKSLAGVAKV